MRRIKPAISAYAWQLCRCYGKCDLWITEDCAALCFGFHDDPVDYCKRTKRRGKQFDKLWAVVEQLLKDEPLEPRHRAHTLSGQWQSFRECHIEPDLILARTGTHADLFE